MERVAVLDVGKTHAKLTLIAADGAVLSRMVHANRAGRFLDSDGVENLLEAGLRDFARIGPVDAIVPVAHGAAAAIVAGDRILFPPVDYELDPGAGCLAAYRAQRDPFLHSGSPAMPLGLNLGAQLHRLEADGFIWPAAARLLLLPQFWAWRLCGEQGAELSSLGCHTDLWFPRVAAPSDLAIRRGWAARLPPLIPASEVLGPLSPEWQRRTGLGPTRILCGIHDSNAALHGARSLAGAHGSGPLLSTGTWFIAMAPGAAWPDPALEHRDVLVNVDPAGKPVPSARFMGGRERELLAGADPLPGTGSGAIDAVIAGDAVPRAGFGGHGGPFAGRRGNWARRPDGVAERQAAISLYLSLMTMEMLDILGVGGPLLIDGPAAHDEIFGAALARFLWPSPVGRCTADLVLLGALRLAGCCAPVAELVPFTPAREAIAEYRAAWRKPPEPAGGNGTRN